MSSYEQILAAHVFPLVLKDITLVPANMAAIHVWKRLLVKQ